MEKQIFSRLGSLVKGNILSDDFLESAMHTIIFLGKSVINYSDSYDIRAQIMQTGAIAHNDLLDWGRNGGDWATHMIEHAVSARYDIAHGADLSILFPAWLLYVGRGRPEKY